VTAEVIDPPWTRNGHLCAIPVCAQTVPAYRLMCDSHWLLVPRQVRRQVLSHYELGRPMPDQGGNGWLSAVRAAIDAVREALIAERAKYR